MRILFGPEHDGLHIDPNEPNGYEWWYFDAISDDERYVLVVIFFLGTPMSPYYKAVVDGKNPLPKDWCGVFITLHERTKSGYKERAYAYNLYRENWGDLAKNGSPKGLNYFRDKPLAVRLGDSTIDGTYSHNGHRFTQSWSIDLNERNLWFGATKANLTFTASFLLDNHSPIESEDGSHNWVCVAPDCQVKGDITVVGKALPFSGRGYHDHNFGRLPWSHTREWFWGRVLYPSGSPENGTVFYALWEDVQQDTRHATKTFVATWDDSAPFRYTTSVPIHPVQTKNGYSPIPIGYDIGDTTTHSEYTVWRSYSLQNGPFYKRFFSESDAHIKTHSWSTGIGEIFQPARLCGPIISRMMWTRIRRRS